MTSNPLNVYTWPYYPIEMPVTSEGMGPATVGEDASVITYEVWDRLLNSHGSFTSLPEAINHALKLSFSSEPSD